MKLQQLINYLQELAPQSLQESYDNAQLITGNPEQEVRGTIISLDCTENVVLEAINEGCNVIIAHHPIVFKGLKKLTGSSYVERTIIEAIKNDIAIYAIHTNLDNVTQGVNREIGNRIGLIDMKVLSPKKATLSKLQTYVPTEQLDHVRKALFQAGAGKNGSYDECSYSSNGIGTFRAGDGANHFVGTIGKQHQEKEVKLEVLFANHLENQILQSLKSAHPYEQVAFDIVPISNLNQDIGSGMIGELREAMNENDFLKQLSQSFNAKVIRHTKLLNKEVKTIAYCGGAGSFLLPQAKAKNADVFITGDFKYHEFFDAEEDLVILDIGHFESEHFTPHLIAKHLEDKNVTFAVLLSEVKTNPIHYYIQ
jgi:dinuclear metal center YbgI/SA1388 family protein